MTLLSSKSRPYPSAYDVCVYDVCVYEHVDNAGFCNQVDQTDNKTS